MLSNLGRSALLGANLMPAIRRFGEAEKVFRELDIREGLATALFNLGYAQSLTGDVAGATASFREATRIFREARKPRMLANPGQRSTICGRGRKQTGLARPPRPRACAQSIQGLNPDLTAVCTFMSSPPFA